MTEAVKPAAADSLPPERSQPAARWHVTLVIICSFAGLATLFAFRAFAFQTFNMPSSSMEPTLATSDFPPDH
jgi:hypothetical protein